MVSYFRAGMIGSRTSVIERGVPQGACGGSYSNARPSILTPLHPSARGIAASGVGAGGYCHGRRGRGFGKGIHVLRSNASFRGERRLGGISPQDTENNNDSTKEPSADGRAKGIWLLEARSIEPQSISAQTAGCKEIQTSCKKASSLYRCKSNGDQNSALDLTYGRTPHCCSLRMAEVHLLGGLRFISGLKRNAINQFT